MASKNFDPTECNRLFNCAPKNDEFATAVRYYLHPPKKIDTHTKCDFLSVLRLIDVRRADFARSQKISSQAKKSDPSDHFRACNL